MKNDSLVVVRLRRDVRDRVQAEATANDRSLSAEIRRLITAHYGTGPEPR